MSDALVEIAAGEFVRRGTARAEWKRVRGRELLVVSAATPEGKRKDIDSSRCPFIAAGVCGWINGD